jgi:hypothetical protein
MTKYDELIKKALEELKNDDDLFVDMIDELDSWNGYADGFRAWDMSEIDDFYSDCKASKLLDDMTGDFNKYDNYFYFSIYGLESTNSKVDLYRDNVDEGELLDNIMQNACNLDFWNHKDFKELIDEIDNYTEEENE